MLERLIAQYEDGRKDKHEVVFRLSYFGKFIIVKGWSITGALFHIEKAFEQYDPEKARFKLHLYKHLYDHFLKYEGAGRFSIRIIAFVNEKTDQYQLLKREQMELDKNRFNPRCLNNAMEIYIPQYNDVTDKFGWLNKSAVMNFKKWLNSKARKAYIKRYAK